MTKSKKYQYCASDHILQISKLSKSIFTKNFKLIIAASISKIFDAYVISPHITQNKLKDVTKL